jgi:hypothetical protein
MDRLFKEVCANLLLSMWNRSADITPPVP